MVSITSAPLEQFMIKIEGGCRAAAPNGMKIYAFTHIFFSSFVSFFCRILQKLAEFGKNCQNLAEFGGIC